MRNRHEQLDSRTELGAELPSLLHLDSDGELTEDWLNIYAIEDSELVECIDSDKAKREPDRLKHLSKKDLWLLVKFAKEHPDVRTSRLINNLSQHSLEYRELRRTQLPSSVEWRRRMLHAIGSSALAWAPINAMIHEFQTSGMTSEFVLSFVVAGMLTSAYVGKRVYQSNPFTSTRQRELRKADRDNRLFISADMVDPKQVKKMVNWYKLQSFFALNEIAERYQPGTCISQRLATWALSSESLWEDGCVECDQHQTTFVSG